MNIHMATLSRAIQIQIAQPPFSENEFSSGKGFGEGDDNLTNYPGSDPCSTYEKEI